jgi:hypothetical protein
MEEAAARYAEASAAWEAAVAAKTIEVSASSRCHYAGIQLEDAN